MSMPISKKIPNNKHPKAPKLTAEQRHQWLDEWSQELQKIRSNKVEWQKELQDRKLLNHLA